MFLQVFQVNSDRDTNGVIFVSLDRLKKRQGTPNPRKEMYDLVYVGHVAAVNLEEVYQALNVGTKPEDYKGRSLSVSDIVEVLNSAKVKPGLYYCDSFGFQPVEWDRKEEQL